MRNGFVGAGHIAIPCAVGACSYAAPNAKSEAWRKVSTPRISDVQKMVCRSGLETLIGLAVVHQVANAIDGIL